MRRPTPCRDPLVRRQRIARRHARIEQQFHLAVSTSLPFCTSFCAYRTQARTHRVEDTIVMVDDLLRSRTANDHAEDVLDCHAPSPEIALPP